MTVPELRPIVWKDFSSDKDYQYCGNFHRFVEQATVVGEVGSLKPMAIVEDHKGVVHIIDPETIKFTDREVHDNG